MEQELTYLVLVAVPTLISAVLLSRFGSFRHGAQPPNTAGSSEEID
ncbi:MAG TPA: hypothetical protein VNO43_18130 [Candidatus Eisenbacteria bacterium]|nr:hypothetical protein [Candidatus Eisenbacteria bacterium]